MYCIVSGKERTEWISNGKRACWTYGVLAVLRRGPSYGYKIIGEVSSCIEVSESTLYPILKRLEANGTSHGHTGARRPYPRYFYITDAGQERIDAFLDEWDEVKRIYAFIKGEEV